jgi:hypothetical protein
MVGENGVDASLGESEDGVSPKAATSTSDDGNFGIGGLSHPTSPFQEAHMDLDHWYDKQL